MLKITLCGDATLIVPQGLVYAVGFSPLSLPFAGLPMALNTLAAAPIAEPSSPVFFWSWLLSGDAECPCSSCQVRFGDNGGCCMVGICAVFWLAEAAWSRQVTATFANPCPPACFKYVSHTFCLRGIPRAQCAKSCRQCGYCIMLLFMLMPGH